jgi:hypothetical protein
VPGARHARDRLEIAVYERLSASLEQQQALRQSMENAQRPTIILMAMIGKLRADIATSSSNGPTGRRSASGPSNR